MGSSHRATTVREAERWGGGRRAAAGKPCWAMPIPPRNLSAQQRRAQSPRQTKPKQNKTKKAPSGLGIRLAVSSSSLKHGWTGREREGERSEPHLWQHFWYWTCSGSSPLSSPLLSSERQQTRSRTHSGMWSLTEQHIQFQDSWHRLK